MNEIRGKRAELSIERPATLRQMAHALSSPVRLAILSQLGKRSMNVRELAEALDMPMSTVALGVKILEEAGIITSEMQRGTRGAMKLCSRRLDSLSVELAPPDEHPASCISVALPVGSYSVADGIEPTCGLASEEAYIGSLDEPVSFYMPDRCRAQLIWFRQGFLEYRFSVQDMSRLKPTWLEVAFEACSEAPMYRDPWKSDIALEINGHRLGVWTSPCDCGGRHGAVTPAWWSELATQFGFLKTWRVDESGSYLEQEKVSDVTLSDLRLMEAPYISIRIGVPADVRHIGGINLFGEKFGDYPQGIIVRIGYQA